MAEEEAISKFLKMFPKVIEAKRLIDDFTKNCGLENFIFLKNRFPNNENEILPLFCDDGWSFTANAVGDANFLELTKCASCHKFARTFVIDFGTKNKNKFKEKFNYNLDFTDRFSDLLISHYHTDHYCCIEYVNDNSLNIKNVYFPKIPEFVPKNKDEQSNAKEKRTLLIKLIGA